MNVEPFTFVIERLSNLFIDEINFLSKDSRKLLRILQQRLELAQSFVRDVEEDNQRGNTNHVLQTEVKHLMQIIPEVEDFLDTFYQEEVEQSQARSSFAKFMACFSCTSNPVIRKHKVIQMVTELTEELQATCQRAGPYQLQNNRPQVAQRPRPPTQPYIISDEFIIGLEEDVRTLVAKLVGKEGDHTTTLAIVGMGGSGKTTLAKKLYNYKDIVAHFTHRAWACISQQWETSCILRKICKDFHIPLPDDKTSVPNVELQEFLQRNSCLVVLDDVWKKDALQELLPVLLSAGSSRGTGKVLVTTRNEDIISYTTLSGVYIHKARFLTPDQSWDLFSKIVRSNWQGVGSFEYESEFAQLGKVMLERCHGLPLAIIALAGILCTKNTIQEWEIMKNDVISRIMKDKRGFHDYGPVKEMLELSYSDLPYDLKPCFLYLGIFKEDSEIFVDDITQLWIGEGFIKTSPSNKSMTLEDVARDYLDELVQRCMVQVVARNYEGKVYTIRIHDLMRDLCIDKAKELNFFEISSSSTSPSTSVEPMAARAIFHDTKSLPTYSPRLRSCIYILPFSVQLNNLHLLYEKMKFLRVLHLESVDLGNSIEQIGNLVLLRCLRIEYCDGIKQLPESMKKLRNLLTFVFKLLLASKVGIPNNMVGSMEHLRHFTLGATPGPILGVDKSRNLQILRVSAGEWLTKELRVVSIGLRVLQLTTINNQAQLEAVSDFVINPHSLLQELELSLDDDSRVEFDLEKLKLERCQLLKSLKLGGKIRKQHPHLLFHPNLLKLELRGTQIEEEEDLKIALAQLGQLRSLEMLTQAYVGDKLTMVGLPQLQRLWLWGQRDLKEWRIEEGGLPQLKQLQIDGCDELERIPGRIGQIHTLQSFSAVGMSESFCKRLRRPSEKEDSDEGGGGEDFHLIQHIPDIRIFH